MLAAATGRADAGAANGPIQRSTVSVRDVISYVDARAHDVLLTPHHLAAHFNVSLRRLYRITAAANCTPSALIWERRLLRAHELLGRSRELPITEVAFSCGFKNSAHFSRAYRRTFGQTPSATRRACLESLARRDTPQFALSRHAS
jgi:transcriptional regulator GlxA family with amidase domain